MTQLGMAFQEWKIGVPVSVVLEKGLIFILKNVSHLNTLFST